MRNLQNIITKKVGLDRLLHFAFGGWLACFGSTWFYALLIGLLIGFVKELFDKYIKKSVFDYEDWVATFLGSIITACVMIL